MVSHIEGGGIYKAEGEHKGALRRRGVSFVGRLWPDRQADAGVLHGEREEGAQG